MLKGDSASARESAVTDVGIAKESNSAQGVAGPTSPLAGHSKDNRLTEEPQPSDMPLRNEQAAPRQDANSKK